jgi:TPP-dependent pyruvate/acetoin dehydrogenase alpha subunit
MESTDLMTVIEADGGSNGYDPGLSDEQLLHCYRTMLLVRAFDDTCMKLQRSGRIGFSIPNLGVEGMQVGAATALRKDDWIFPCYRNFGMALYHGISPVDMMHNMYGNSRDSAVGRQMPVHFSFVDPIHWVSISSPIGTQIPQAVGAARAFQLRGEDKVCLTSFGDGGTSSLGFHSGLNFAGVWKAPIVFLCQNNGYAISCSSEQQTASESYAIKGKAYGIPGVKVDGNDLLAVRRAVCDAVDKARAGDGPTLIEAETFRMGGHSTSDDPTRYVPKELVAEWAAKDPVDRFERFLGKRGLWKSGDREALYAECMTQVGEAAKVAESTGAPGLETIFSDVYADLPDHLRRQGEAAFDLATRRGDAATGGGAFPL